MKLLQIIARVDGDQELADRYIVEFDPNHHHQSGYDGGRLVTTEHANEARHFTDVVEALEYWKLPATCECHSTRPWDGKPNRPLTAFHVKVVEAKEDTA